MIISLSKGDETEAHGGPVTHPRGTKQIGISVKMRTGAFVLPA